ncbi:MAG: bifunctional metallophosphatase/5'-nucleotidase [Oscillospiraceae bacterium]|nr:bifunctional metallophosphatase/5'-nucleotidase [Oscillospiraceae bacterium]
MEDRMKRLLILILSVLMLIGMVACTAKEAEEAPAPSNEATETREPKDLVVLFTSDVHCGVSDGFGYEGVKAVKDSFEKDGYQVILVDDGDAIQGAPVGTLTTGEAIITLMNATGYDVAIPGNHEFDYGMDRFLELVGKAEFPYISANFNKEGELVFEPYKIFDWNDTKVAFVGVTTPKTLTTSTPKYFKDDAGNFVYGFFQDQDGTGVYEAVQKAVDAARAEGAEYVVLMAHLGNEADCSPWTYADVVSHTNGINVVVDGHSHDTDQVVMKNKDNEDVIRSACGTKLSGIGCIKFEAESGKITNELISWNNSVPAPKLLGITNDVTTAVAASTDALNAKISEVVATTSVELTITDPEAKDSEGHPIRIIRNAETNLGDLCADAYKDQGEADIAFVNGGGIRKSIGKGDITLGDILSVHPFGNSMCVIEVSGQQILDALEWGARNVPGELGGFLQVSGLTYEIHTYIPSSCTQDDNGMFTGVAGEYRVKNVMVGDEPLDLNKTYTLASHNYMLKDNGDGFTMFEGCNILQDEVKLDNQVLIDYITKTLGGNVGTRYAEPYGEGRIVAVEEPQG